MKENDEIIIYGCGRRGETLCQLFQKHELTIKYVVDSNPSSWGKKFCGYTISSPEIIRQLQDAPVCITIADGESIKQVRNMLAIEYGYKLENEIAYEHLFASLVEKSKVVRNAIKNVSFDKSTEKMIVFDCSNGLGLGGIEAWTKSLCMELLERRWDNICILTGMGNYDVPVLLDSICEKLEINEPGRLQEDAITNVVEFLLGKLPCKVITSHVNVVMIAASIIKKNYPDAIEIISVIHGGEEVFYSKNVRMKRYIDAYVGVSEDIVKEIVHRGVESTKVLHMTCPVERVEVLERNYQTNNSLPIRLGYAGRLDKKQKRMDLLLKMIEHLEKLQVNYEFQIAGTGVYEEQIRQFIQDNELSNKIQLLGNLERSKIPDFWQKRDICINIADFEGRSITIMEAMENGAIPVVSATSGVKEDITDGWNGCIVKLGDYAEMARKIAQLEKKREVLCEMGNRAHDVIHPKANMENHVQFWEQVLKR